MKANPDKISMASRNKISDVAITILDRFQGEQPEVQLWALAVLFASVAHRLGVDPAEMHTKAQRMLNPEPFDRTGNERYRAILDYTHQELRTN